MRFLYTRQIDGGLSVVNAAPKEHLERLLGPMTDEEYKAHVIERSIPKNAINMVEVEDSFKLPDREFRNAWKQDGKAVDFDLVKAKNIQLSKIRAAREPKLEALDQEFMLALEKGDSTAAIVAKKQALRDITEPLKALDVKNIEDVKKAFPEALKEKV